MNIPLIINALIMFSLAFAISSICIPLIIKIAKKKELFSEIGGRHIHTRLIPRLGGIAILLGFIVSQLYFILELPFSRDPMEAYYLLIFSILVLFLLGLLDDMVNIKPNLKFFIQLLVAIILVWRADIRIDSFFGIFGIHDLPLSISYAFSITVIVFFINAYNIIDGLDGLSCSVGLYVLACFTLIFMFNKIHIDTMLSFSAMGCLFGFWLFNKPPAKIFMGDSGTLSIGLLLAYFSIKVSNLPLDYNGTFNPVFAMVVLAYPVIDTLRVFVRRISNGKSPFSADRNHIHHALYDLNLGHAKSTAIVILCSFLLTVIAYALRSYHNLSFFIMVSLILLISQIPFILLNSKNK